VLWLLCLWQARAVDAPWWSVVLLTVSLGMGLWLLVSHTGSKAQSSLSMTSNSSTSKAQSSLSMTTSTSLSMTSTSTKAQSSVSPTSTSTKAENSTGSSKALQAGVHLIIIM